MAKLLWEGNNRRCGKIVWRREKIELQHRIWDGSNAVGKHSKKPERKHQMSSVMEPDVKVLVHAVPKKLLWDVADRKR